MDSPCLRCRVTRAGGFFLFSGLVQQGGSARLRHGVGPWRGTVDPVRRWSRGQRAHRSLRVPPVLHGLPGRAADRARIRCQGSRVARCSSRWSSWACSRSSSRGRSSSHSPTPSTFSATSLHRFSRARNRRCSTIRLSVSRSWLWSSAPSRALSASGWQCVSGTSTDPIRRWCCRDCRGSSRCSRTTSSTSTRSTTAPSCNR